jgi:hypothetical protein
VVLITGPGESYGVCVCFCVSLRGSGGIITIYTYNEWTDEIGLRETERKTRSFPVPILD